MKAVKYFRKGLFMMQNVLKNVTFSKDTYTIGENIELSFEYEEGCEDIVIGFAPDVNASLFDSYVFSLAEQKKADQHVVENNTYHLQLEVNKKITGHCKFLYAIIKKNENDIEVYKTQGCEVIPMILTLMMGKEASKQTFVTAPIIEGMPEFNTIDETIH